MTTRLAVHPLAQPFLDSSSVKERPRTTEHLTLAALPSAASSARSFVTSRLEQWNAPLAVGDAVHLVEQMVKSAVQVVGVSDPDVQWSKLDHLEVIEVHLLDLRRSIGIEVWDNGSPFPGSSPTAGSIDSELLNVLNTAAGHWGIMPSGRGRIVWAELPVYERTDMGLPVRPPTLAPQQRQRPLQLPGTDLLRRVRDGLEKL